MGSVSATATAANTVRPVVREVEVESTRFANLAVGLYAAFLNIVGLVFTLTGAFMSEWLGVAGWVATVFGVVALLVSFVVTLFANRKIAKRGEVSFVIKMNLAILAIAIIVLVWPGSMSAAGKTTLVVGAAVVAAFTLAQAFARRGLPADD